MILSILVPTLKGRENLLNRMIESLGDYNRSEVEVIEMVDSGQVTTGYKRNLLLNMAKGKYVWFIDDDDLILNDGLNKVLSACKLNPDVVTFNGFMTTDGINREDFEIRLGHGYETIKRNGKNFYLRYPNHITPMKKHIALQVGFPDLTYKEDYIFARELNEKRLLKTEIVINEDIYHYVYIKNK